VKDHSNKTQNMKKAFRAEIMFSLWNNQKTSRSSRSRLIGDSDEIAAEISNIFLQTHRQIQISLLKPNPAIA
jgi:hypothetical protein